MSSDRTILNRKPFLRARPSFEILERRSLLSGSILDTSFGTGGSVQTSFEPTHEDANPVAVLVEHDYKSIVVGTAGPGFSFGGGNADFEIGRYTVAGQPDTTFGMGGTTLTDISGGDDFATAAALQSDGKTVVVGYSGSGNVELARYTTSGKLDTSFGTKGTVITNLGVSAVSRAVAIDAQGRIVVVGVTSAQFASFPNYRSTATGNLFIARYLPSGKLDTTFGHNGIVSYTSGTFTGVGANSVTIDSAGKILIGGSIDNNFLAARFTSSGALDTTFGNAGVTQVKFKGAATAVSIAIVSGGKIILGGTNVPSNANDDSMFALTRLTSSGKLDTPFGTAGIATTDFGQNAQAYQMAIQHNGAILLTGTENPISATNYDLLARYTTSGKLDNSFNGGGFAAFDPSDGHHDISNAFAVAVQTDGRILVAGEIGVSEVDFTDSIFLTRFFGDAPASVSGKVFDDKNGNSLLNAGEPGLPSIKLYLDLNDDGVFDAGDYYVLSDANGDYTFANLAPGTYEIREVVPAGKHLTAPAGGVVTLTLSTGENVTGKNFGNEG